LIIIHQSIFNSHPQPAVSSVWKGEPESGGVARRRFISRAGVVPKPEYHGLLALAEEPPRLRPLRKLRDIFLWAQPPLLTQEGSFHSDASRRLLRSSGPTRFCASCGLFPLSLSVNQT